MIGIQADIADCVEMAIYDLMTFRGSRENGTDETWTHNLLLLKQQTNLS